MDEKLFSILQHVGLSDGEIRVYVALLKLRESTVGNIIKEAKVSSSKVYVILDKLIDKGLCTYIIEDKVKSFQAARPLAIKEYLEEKEKKISELKKEVDQVIIDLETLSSTLNSEEAKIYKGYEGLKVAYYEALKTVEVDSEYLFFSVKYGEVPQLKRFFTILTNKLKEKNIKIKGIGNEDERKQYEKYYVSLGYEVRFSQVTWPSDLTILGDNVLILVWNQGSPVVYLLKSRILSESYRAFFYSTWEHSKK